MIWQSLSISVTCDLLTKWRSPITHALFITLAQSTLFHSTNLFINFLKHQNKDKIIIERKRYPNISQSHSFSWSSKIPPFSSLICVAAKKSARLLNHVKNRGYLNCSNISFLLAYYSVYLFKWEFEYFLTASDVVIAVLRIA